MVQTASRSIRASGLVKRFGDTVAVDGLDLSVTPGTCLGILGPNGAGKTTTIEMLEGLVVPDSGTVEILGLVYASDAAEIRQRIGVQLQETLLPDRLRVAEVLRVFRSLYLGGLGALSSVEEMLEQSGLGDKRSALVAQLSGGQRQRLSLGCALIHRPEILFLDEPTTGLDPTARREVWSVVEAFKAGGGTVILTTHFMEEAERLADQLLILDQGKVLQRGTPAEIVASLGAENVLDVTLRRAAGGQLDDADLEGALADLPDVSSVVRPGHGTADGTGGDGTGARVRLGVTGFQRVLAALLPRLEQRGLVIEDLAVHKPTLDDVFVSLTGRELEP